MGEAKRRASTPPRVVYHHTSTLWTNLIWMSGVIELEGRPGAALHPVLGEVQTGVEHRRACEDFPPLAWFTSDIRIPGCLLATKLMLQSKNGTAMQEGAEMMGEDPVKFLHGIALNRMALGFPADGSTIMRWRDHPGYATPEGRDLNETARGAGDDPNRWYVSQRPVDVMTASEVWASSSIFTPKLERQTEYLKHVHQMVALCRRMPNTYIPPTWFNDPTVSGMIRKSGRALPTIEALSQAQSRQT